MLSSSLSCVGSERSLFPCALWYQEPVKNEEPVKRQAAPVTVGSTAPAAPMMPVCYLLGPCYAKPGTWY